MVYVLVEYNGKVYFYITSTFNNEGYSKQIDIKHYNKDLSMFITFSK